MEDTVSCWYISSIMAEYFSVTTCLFTCREEGWTLVNGVLGRVNYFECMYECLTLSVGVSALPLVWV